MLELLVKRAALIFVVSALFVFSACNNDSSSGDKSTDDLIGANCANAISIELSVLDVDNGGYTGPIGTIGYPADADHYMLNVTEGEYYLFSTDSNPPDEASPPLLDPVVSLFDETGKILLATADDQYPRRSVDSELFYRANFTGSVCIKVEDWSTWTNESPQGDPTYQYALIATSASDLPFVAVESEPNNTPQMAQSVADTTIAQLDFEWGLVCGTLEDSSDQDVYSLELGIAQKDVVIYALPLGEGKPGEEHAQGHGSTLGGIIVDQLNSSDEIVGSINTSDQVYEVNVPGEDNTPLRFRVRADADMTVGGNDFYCLRFFSITSQATFELEEADHSNDSFETAEPLLFSEKSVTVKGNIDPAGDLDYYSIDAKAGESYGILCWAQTSGSGLEGAAFAIHSPEDIEIQSQAETMPDPVFWHESQHGGSAPPVTIEETDTYYLVVSATGQSDEIIGSYYSCIVDELSDK